MKKIKWLFVLIIVLNLFSASLYMQSQTYSEFNIIEIEANRDISFSQHEMSVNEMQLEQIAKPLYEVSWSCSHPQQYCEGPENPVDE